MSYTHTIEDVCQHCGQPIPLGVKLDKSTLTVSHNGRTVRLTYYEFEVLEEMCRKFPKAAQHLAIFNALYQLRPDCDGPDSDTLKVFIHRLRKKLAPIGIGIKNVYKVGYVVQAHAEIGRGIAA